MPLEHAWQGSVSYSSSIRRFLNRNVAIATTVSRWSLTGVYLCRCSLSAETPCDPMNCRPVPAHLCCDNRFLVHCVLRVGCLAGGECREVKLPDQCVLRTECSDPCCSDVRPLNSPAITGILESESSRIRHVVVCSSSPVLIHRGSNSNCAARRQKQPALCLCVPQSSREPNIPEKMVRQHWPWYLVQQCVPVTLWNR